MNERIQELALQARKHFPKTESSGEFWVFDEQKFAELIVKECAGLVKGQLTIIPEDQKDWDGHNYGYTAAVYETLDRFKEHFGVEE